MENQPLNIIVHHTANSSKAPQFDSTNLYHKTKFDWISSLGFYVAYHRFIERDGTVFIARSDLECGPHTKGQNCSGLAVCLAGDFDIETPTTAQISALCGIIDEWSRKYGIPLNHVYPHRHFVNTSCYGKNLPDDWAAIQAISYRLSFLRRWLLQIMALLHL